VHDFYLIIKFLEKAGHQMQNCESINFLRGETMKKVSLKFKIVAGLILISIYGLAIAPCFCQDMVSISINPSKVEGRVDEKIYGHFLEHIYHSVNGGLWGELVWNRSFEEATGAGRGKWTIKDDCLVQSKIADNVKLVFGDNQWSDYEFSLEAQKTDGAEAFLILFRVLNDEKFYWYNIGGWGNVQSALEKAVMGRGWGIVGPIVRNNIETGKWYKIVVRCEGAHLQVKLDDKTMLDFTDQTNPHLKGCVGLGTWNTKAKYRNIKVTSLDGKILFEGLPELKKEKIGTRFWQFYGKGQASLTEDNPLNSNWCQIISSETNEAGLEQKPFYIRKGEVYNGSIWVRGEAPDGMAAKLLDGDKIIDKVELAAPKNNWSELKFTFKPRVDAKDAMLQVGVKGKGKIWLDQVSLMAKSSEKVGGYRPDLLKAVADIRPPVIRWPGGCFASPYRWKDGIGPQYKRKVYPREIWDDLEINAYGTDEFIRMCKKIGAEPLIVVNIGTRAWNDNPNEEEFLQDVLDWIEYCNGPVTSKWGNVRAENGHRKPYNVKFWEIDNETWGMGAENYIAAVRKFAPAMKKADPMIKLAVCGSGGFDLEWNRRMIDGCAELIDYLSIHHYENPDIFAKGPYNYERFIHQTGELITKSKNPNLKIYCSEWNAQSIDWRTGLYAGGVLNAFERCSDVFEMAGPALFLRHLSATAWNNAFINLDYGSWFQAPNYVVMKLWRDHYAPNRISIEGDIKGLNVVATKSQNGKKVYFKVVNPSDNEREVNLTLSNGFKIKKTSMEVVSPGSLDARNSLENPDAVKPVKGKVEMSGQNVKFKLPSLSAAVVTIEGS
jgi:alpha-N-arabinofuranosidase